MSGLRSNTSPGSSKSPSMSMASLFSNGAQHRSSRCPLPRLPLVTHAPQNHTFAQRERVGRGSDFDSESDDSGSEPLKPPPKKHKHANAKSKQTTMKVERVEKAEKADEGFSAVDILSGIDLRVQMAAWERLKDRDGGKQSSRSIRRERGPRRGRGAGPARSQSNYCRQRGRKRRTEGRRGWRGSVISTTHDAIAETEDGEAKDGSREAHKTAESCR
ncbi:hypothetical protein BDN71DRAFT_525161 [Pleurotus eryngii]|uniref:Uncharacterized protein n=1 Tax=Pleurotus eryngii TaxID=5323 RepID=A0A9P5ZLU0_PLEER|nr:hypothetical protein BDN71DRAFT_525161 [Pleurotus eryngii]